MSSNLERAVKLLKTGNYTLTAVNDEMELTFMQRGVKPLLGLLENKQSLNGFSAADKVIGKAAAFLYVMLNPDEIYAGVISRAALHVLTENHIHVQYDILTEAIRNRTNTGFCPMETAVRNTIHPDEAIIQIYDSLKKLS